MIDPNDPNNQNQNPNIINPTVQPNVQSNQPFQPRQRGTGFTNIKRVLGANVGAGQQLAGRIGGAITGQAQRVRQNLGQQQQQFQTGFQKSRQEALANIASATSLTKQPGESDEQYEARLAAQAPDYTQIGQNLRTAEYAGPTGFQNPNLLLSQAQTAGKIGSFARSGLGQGILARQYGAGRGTYTTGQNILDQMFLSQDPNAQRAIQQARQSTVGLGQTVQGAAAAAEETARATQEGVEQAKVQAAQDIQRSLGGIAARGTEAANQFYADRDRFNQLMTATKSTDTAGNPVYKDSAGNILSLTDRDYQLIDNPSQFGLDASNIIVGAQNQQTQAQANARREAWAADQSRYLSPRNDIRLTYDQISAIANNPYPYGTPEANAYYRNVLGNPSGLVLSEGPTTRELYKNALDSYVDPTDTNITQGILADIAKSGIAANVGAIKYTPEQEAAARNLQLLSGNIPKAYTPFETDLYGIDSANIADKSNAYSQLEKGLGYNPANENERQSVLQSQAASKVNALSTQPLIDPSKDVMPQIESLKSLTQNQINEMLQSSVNDDAWTQGYNDKMQLLNALNNIQQDYQTQLGINKTTSLQNYLANLYNRQQQS